MKYEICIVYRDEIGTEKYNAEHYYIEDNCFYMELGLESLADHYDIKIVPLHSVVRIEIRIIN